eukprot:gene2526-1581_t
MSQVIQIQTQQATSQPKATHNTLHGLHNAQTNRRQTISVHKGTEPTQKPKPIVLPNSIKHYTLEHNLHTKPQKAKLKAKTTT